MAGKSEFKGLGRRKSSVAKVKLVPGSGKILINNRTPENYFPNELVIQDMMLPLTITESTKLYDVFVSVRSGGFTGQAGAIRLGIARALLNKPNILILDKPTNGLDPEGIKDLRVLLKRLASDGMGILISSHNLAELESFCNKVRIIDNGTIIESSEVTTLKNNENIVVFKVSDTTKIDIKDIFDVNKTSFKVSASKENIAKIIKKLVKDGIDIYEVKNEELTLEEAFLKKTKGGK